MEGTKSSAPSLYPIINSLSEQYINEKLLANYKFKNKIINTKDIKNYCEDETELKL